MAGGNIVFQLTFLGGITLYFMGMIYISIKKPFYLGVIPPVVLWFTGVYCMIKPRPVYEKPGVRLEAFLILLFWGLSLIGFSMLMIIKIFLYVKKKMLFLKSQYRKRRQGS